MVEMDTTVHAMPEGWNPGSDWHVAVHPDGRIVAGGASGLYLLGEEIEQIDGAAVRGILTHPDLGFIVATDEGLLVYDAELLPSALDEQLGDAEVESLARRGAEMWLVTDDELFELEGEMLWSYPDMVGIRALRTHDDASHLVAENEEGLVTLLRNVDATMTAQDLSEELEGLTNAALGPQDRVFAIADDGALFERVTVDGGVLWHPVALTTDEGDPGATGVERFVADPVGGALWLTIGETLHRIDGGDVISEVAWPSEMGATDRLVATADGAVWMSTGTELVRVGPDTPPPSYAQHIVPWYEDNCASCHEAGGEVATTTRFESFDGFAANVETIIEQIDQGYMPAGETELVGDPDLPRKWRDGGMRP
jgi:hypothetical protein